MKFALHEFMTGAVDRMVMVSREKGGYTSKRLRFMPDEVYETKDPVFIQYIKGEIGDANQKMVATPEIKSTLESYSIEYYTTKCGHCANAKPKVVFNPFKIIEE